MSRNLRCDFSVKTGKGPSYWWPLMLERLWFRGFQFASPLSNEHLGYYSYFRSSEEGDTVNDKFQVLWDEVYSEMGGVSAIFWFKEEDNLRTLELSSNWRKELCHFEFSLTMPSADFSVLPMEEAQKWLLYILTCIKDIYELCLPISGTILWEDSSGDFAPWASFDVAPIHSSEQRSLSNSNNQCLCSEELSNGRHFFYFDPVPMARKTGWDFISLQK